MNIVFLTYQNIDTDGRTKELLRALTKLANVTVISKKWNNKEENVKTYFVEKGGYFNFIKEAVKLSSRINEKMDYIFIDNRRATIPGLKIQKKLGCRMIYDARELYLRREVDSLSGIIGCYFEKKVIENSELVIATNEFRRNIMEKEFSIKNKIIVFDNFRKLEYSNDADIEVLQQKYGDIFSSEDKYVISTAGCDINRDTDKLVRAMKKLEGKARLLLVGCKEDSQKEEIEHIIEEEAITNVEMIGRVQHDDLKYLISKSNIGVAMYHKKNQNNLYCSSGKIYEFLFEGIPIATSDNPSLKSVIDKYNVGSCNEDIYIAINDVCCNYELYRKNVQAFMGTDIIEKEQNSFHELLANILTSM